MTRMRVASGLQTVPPLPCVFHFSVQLHSVRKQRAVPAAECAGAVAAEPASGPPSAAAAWNLATTSPARPLCPASAIRQWLNHHHCRGVLQPGELFPVLGSSSLERHARQSFHNSLTVFSFPQGDYFFQSDTSFSVACMAS